MNRPENDIEPSLPADFGEEFGEAPEAPPFDADFPAMSQSFGAPEEAEPAEAPAAPESEALADALPVRGASGSPPEAERRPRRPVLSVPIEVVISVGKARPLLSDLVKLRRDSVLSLDSKIEDPVEIIVGGRVIARGELQELDETGRLGVRLTDVEDVASSI